MENHYNTVRFIADIIFLYFCSALSGFKSTQLMLHSSTNSITLWTQI